MEAIRKQASRLREQVARQQQAVFKQFGGGGYGSGLFDEAEFNQHQKLEKHYISTCAAKHYQRDIVCGVEGYIVTGSKQVEIGAKLSEDSRKYGSDNTCTNGNVLTRAALSYGRARAQMEKEHGNMLKVLGTQIPNGFGCALGTLQLILYFIYCGNKGEKSADTEKDEKTVVEMKGEEKKQNVVFGKQDLQV